MGRVDFQNLGTCESRLGLDIRSWHRSGALIEGTRFSQSWHRGDRRVATLSATRRRNLVVASLCDDVGHPEKAVALELMLCASTCRYGGMRPWFVCRCGRRCAKLYHDGDRGFRCRQCLNLVYESQRLNTALRAMALAQKLRMRLGGNGDLRELFPERPKRLRRATYERLRRRATIAEERAFDLVFKRLHRDPAA